MTFNINKYKTVHIFSYVSSFARPLTKGEPEETGKNPKDFILYDDLCSIIKHTVLNQVKDFTNDLMRSATITEE